MILTIIVAVYVIGFAITYFIMSNNEEWEGLDKTFASLLWFIFWPIILLIVSSGKDE